MKLSVIVATRNRAHAITCCLDSIAASLAHAASLDAEIVVVDNGSTDATSEIVKRWASACPFPVRGGPVAEHVSNAVLFPIGIGVLSLVWRW
jgi:glycosyltransferase involved in cell wall biosynthesis